MKKIIVVFLMILVSIGCFIRRFSMRFLITIVVLLIPFLSFGTTYYVDATLGDDDSTGTSIATAWQTIAKVNAVSFNAGDQILFKRGETWAEDIVVPDDGTSGNQITFSTYGSGDNPTVDQINVNAKDYITIDVNITTNYAVVNSGTGLAWLNESLNENSLKVEIGKYKGTGDDDLDIVGLNFEPKFLMIKGDRAKLPMAFSLEAMSDLGDSSWYSTNQAATGNVIQSLDSDGFTIGTDSTVNLEDTTYIFMAIGGDDSYIKTGSYSGNATERWITADLEPGFVFLKIIGTTGNAIWRSSNMPDDSSCGLSAPAGDDYIQRFNSSGFQVGTHNTVNQEGQTIVWVAIKENTEYLEYGTYIGDDADDRDITYTEGDWSASAVFTKQWDQWDGAVFSTEDESDYTYQVQTITAAVNKIQSISAGGFQLGSHGAANEDGTEFYWFSFRQFLLFAETYYVDATSGNDDSTGTSVATAWQTIAKVNAQTLVPGDQILLKHGGTWTEDIVVPDDGTSGNPITFSTYGSGDNPIVDQINVNAKDYITIDANITTNYAVVNSGTGFAWLNESLNENDFKVDAVKYKGTGVDGMEVYIPGFGTPKFVFIGTDNGAMTAMRFDTQVGDLSFNSTFDTALANVIQSINEDYITVGTDTAVNKADTTYSMYWLGGDDDYIKTFTYTGDGNDDRNYSFGGSWEPGFALIKNSGETDPVRLRTYTMEGDSTISYTGNCQANMIQGFAKGIIELGTDDDVNSNGETYHGFAVRKDEGCIVSGTYVGNETDNTDITLPVSSFTPIVMHSNKRNSYWDGVWTTDAITPISYRQRGGGGFLDVAIKSFSAGTFRIGGGSLINELNKTFVYWAFKQYTSDIASIRFRTFPRFPRFPR